MEAPVMISAMFQQCEGRCGTVVRIDAPFCDACAQLDHMYERKLSGSAGNRFHGTGEFARHDRGVAPWPSDGLGMPPDLRRAENEGQRAGIHSTLIVFGLALLVGLMGKAFAFGLGNLFTHLGQMLARVFG